MRKGVERHPVPSASGEGPGRVPLRTQAGPWRAGESLPVKSLPAKHAGLVPDMAGTARFDRAVLRALGGSTRFRSCQEIHGSLSDARPAAESLPSLSTVYRSLHRLAGQGVLDMIRSAEGERLYRLCDTSSHHHHLLCRGCGRVEEIPQVEELSSILGRVRRQSGFRSLDHVFELSGICPDCA